MADESDDHPQEEKKPFRDLAKCIEEAIRLPALSASGVDVVRQSGVVEVFDRSESGGLQRNASLRLATHGDTLEQRYAPLFLDSKFQAYEQFWILHVVPVTKRDTDRSIHFKTDAELGAIGKGPEDIHIAQLHHTVLRHLARVYELKGSPKREEFIDGIVRLVSALDVAFELLCRFKNRGVHPPFDSRKSEKARKQWRNQEGDPLAKYRDYRNTVVHGCAIPEIHSDVVYMPKIGVEGEYADWRKVTDGDVSAIVNRGDFLPAQTILSDAWSQVVEYCQTAWTTHLM
jgi:hypothetical protein